jgi:predicted nucleic acid-binding protein
MSSFWNAGVIHLDETISIRATQYVSDFALSHSMDALLAGTAVENGGELLTANTKHFECIMGLTLMKFVP